MDDPDQTRQVIVVVLPGLAISLGLFFLRKWWWHRGHQEAISSKMRRKKVPFPYPPLPEGEVSPRHEPGHPYDLVQRDARIIRWFVEDEMGLKFESSPLGHLLDAYDKWDRNAAVSAPEDIPKERRRYLLHFSAHFERLAWAIRALYGAEGRVERMDGSFVRREVLAADTKERDAERVLPGGIGTMMFAGRLVQAGGGRVCIYGNQMIGHDIRWTTAMGKVVLVERKDRSYEAGLSDTTEKRARRVIDEVKDARIPDEPGACRVLTVGFQHVVLTAEMEQTDKFYQRALEEEFKNIPKAALPQLVVIEHLGLEAGGEWNDFFSPQMLNWDSTFDGVGRLLLRALGVEPD